MSANTSILSNRWHSASISMEGAGPIALLGRFLFALIFLTAAPNHFSSQTIAYAASQGVPLALIAVPLVIALVGGLSILLGYRAKIGAWAAGAVPGRGHADAAQLLDGHRPDDAADADDYAHEERFHAGRRALHHAIWRRTLES